MAIIKEQTDVSDGRDCVRSIIDGFAVLIGLQRNLLTASAEADDEGTNSLMSDYIKEQEKLVWMYRSFLGE
jgi:starvation-inducible DNA-binding protein